MEANIYLVGVTFILMAIVGYLVFFKKNKQDCVNEKIIQQRYI